MSLTYETGDAVAKEVIVVDVPGGFVAPVLPFGFRWEWSKKRFILRADRFANVMLHAFPVGMRRPQDTAG